MQTYSKNPDSTRSPFLSKQVMEYLEINGFKSRHKLDPNSYYNGDKKILVTADAIDVLIRKDEEPGERTESWQLEYSHIGISRLSLFGWMLLLHITDVVTINSFVRSVIKEGVFFNTAEVLTDMFKHFGVTDNREALPLAY